MVRERKMERIRKKKRAKQPRDGSKQYVQDQENGMRKKGCDGHHHNILMAAMDVGFSL